MNDLKNGGSGSEREPKSPKSAEAQDDPEPERPTTPQEEAGVDIAELDDPPQAEGEREETEP